MPAVWPTSPAWSRDRSKVTANPIRAYAAVTAAYWAFMLSDGALRMLVLLHFNALGFTPVQLAWLFLLYEALVSLPFDPVVLRLCSFIRAGPRKGTVYRFCAHAPQRGHRRSQ